MLQDHHVYLDHLKQVFGQPDKILKVDSTKAGLPPVVCFVYHDNPEPGLMTGITYGLSCAEHPDWKTSKPELMVCVESQDESWALAAARFAEAFRGERAFTYDDLFSDDVPISSESGMTGFFVFPTPYSREQTTVELPTKTVRIIGFYPLYPAEVPYIRQISLENFWHLEEYDPVDVRRPDLSQMGTPYSGSD